MFGKGFAKYLRRSPLSDEELVTALTWIRDEVDSIINGTDSLPIPDMPASVVMPNGGHVASLPSLTDLEPFMPAAGNVIADLIDTATA